MSRDRLAFAFLNAGHFCDHFFMLIYPTAVLALATEFSQSYDSLLSLATVGFIAFGAGSLPAGWLGDRWSRTGMMTVYFVGIGLAGILTGFASSPAEIGIGLGLIGLFASIYHPIGIALVAQSARRVGRALGINGVFGNLGVALAAVTTGALTDLVSWRAAFIAPGAVALATGIAYGLLFARGGKPAGGAAFAQPRPAAVSLGRRDQIRIFAVLIVGGLFGGVVFHAATVALPKVFGERLADIAQTTFGIGSLVSVVFAAAALAQILVGNWLDRYAFKWLLILVTSIQVPLLLAAAGAEGAGMLLVSLPLMFFIFGEIPIHDWMVARYVAESWRSRVYAAKYVLSLGVSALAVPLVAWLYGATGGFTVLFIVLAACVAVIVLTALVVLPRACSTPLPARAAAAAPRMGAGRHLAE